MNKGLSGKPEDWVGKTVEVLSMDNKLNFMGRISTYDGKVMNVEEATGHNTPSVIYNQEIKLKVFSGGTPVIVYGYICGSTSRFWRLDRLESCNVSEKREHFRHSLFTTAKVVRTGEPDSSGAPAAMGEPLTCRVIDVSAGGVLIRCREEYKVGDHLAIVGLEVVPEMESFAFNCVIKRASRDEEELDYLYGCQFIGLRSKDEDRIMKAILMAQREKLNRDRQNKI